MGSGAFIVDVVLIGQPPRPDIQPHSQGIGFHIQPQGGDKFRGRPSPLWPFRRYQGGNSLQHRVRRLLPQLRFPPLQLPHKPFLVPFEVEALVLLIPPRNVQGGGVVCPPLLWSRKAPSAAPNKPLVPESHIKLIIGLLLAGVMYNQEANPAYIGKPFQFGNYLIVVGIAVLSAPASRIFAGVSMIISRVSVCSRTKPFSCSSRPPPSCLARWQKNRFPVLSTPNIRYNRSCKRRWLSSRAR